jgi:hypothetical protein
LDNKNPSVNLNDNCHKSSPQLLSHPQPHQSTPFPTRRQVLLTPEVAARIDEEVLIAADTDAQAMAPPPQAQGMGSGHGKTSD